MKIGISPQTVTSWQTFKPSVKQPNPFVNPNPFAGKADIVELSVGGKSKSEEFSQLRQDVDMLIQQLEASRAQAGSQSKEMETKLKCLQIAMRIMRGDDVPWQDHRFLAENDSKLYLQAMSLRTENDHPEKHKRLSEDEESSNASDAAAVPEVSGEGEVSEAGETESE